MSSDESITNDPMIGGQTGEVLVLRHWAFVMDSSYGIRPSSLSSPPITSDPPQPRRPLAIPVSHRAIPRGARFQRATARHVENVPHGACLTADSVGPLLLLFRGGPTLPSRPPSLSVPNRAGRRSPDPAAT